MQYKEGSLKSKRPYRTRRLTDSNCAIGVEKQVKLYIDWLVKRGRRNMHVWPAGKTGHAAQVRLLVATQVQCGLKLKEVNPEDWKCG